MNSLTGTTINWSFEDGPMARVHFEHELNADGSVTWRILDGQHKDAVGRAPSYAAERVNHDTWVVSYLSPSGHTLTVVMNLVDGSAFGIASNDTSWVPMRGRFEIVPAREGVAHAR